MKIIELLNKIANGEEVPKCIRYNNENYYFKDNEYRDFVNEEVVYSTLNDEIEIIEEPKKIEKIYHCCMETSNEEIKFLIQNINDLSDTLNKIIDKINGDNNE